MLTNNSRREPVGTCFLARNQFRDFAEYAPCRTREWGYHRQGSCQAGLGVSISRDGQRLFIGAVGSRYWQGELYSINDRVRLLYLPPQYTVQIKGMVISQDIDRRPDVLSTREGPYTEDDTYMGYSITVGNFGGNIPGHEDVAVGRPRGANLLGQVLLYTWNLTNIQNITGEQLGSYFGYSMTTSDVDGDKKDDLIIGAPLYTDLNNNEGKYETGRVYILYQGSGSLPFNELHIKDGKNSKGRFGLALTTLGDINKDGYGDFAVGAPYDGPDERGAVYLFHGGKNGVRESHSQVVYAEDIVGSPSTFGFSLSGGRDLDENDYPDLVVGAYDSNTAVFLRARPVVKVDASINFLTEGKQIALEERNCSLRDGTKVPCVQINSCLKYNGEGVEKRLDFEVQFVLDSKKQRSPRLSFLSEEGKSSMNQSLRLIKGVETCKSMYVYLKRNIRDKLTSLDAEIRYSLLGISNRPSRQLSPILDLDEELSRKDSLSIRKNCGKDNICIPDLRLIAQPSVERYLLGSGERFYLNILVENEGEDAFEASFKTTIPAGMNYVKIERLDAAEKEIPVQCSPPSFINNYTLHCDIGNPLPREKLVEFKVILQPFHQDGMKPRYEFQMTVNSTNPENGTTTSDNLKRITVPIWVETELILQGSSHPADVHYNSSLYYKTDNFTHESEIGPQVIHVYGIRNKGPSDIVEAEAYFLWPSYTLAGEHLLYLLEQPETAGNMRCELVENVNVEHLALDRKRKPFLEQTGVSVSESTSAFFHSTSDITEHESHSSSSGKELTSEERLKIEESRRKQEEIAMKETGEGSYMHGERARNNFKEIHYSSNGGRLESDSHSKSVLVDERGRVEVSKAPVASDRSYFVESGRDRHTSGSRDRGFSGSSIGSGSGNRGSHVHYEEKEQTSQTTWSSGKEPKTVTSTKWKTVDDGVEKSGSSSNVQSGSSNINLANLGLSSAGNKRYTLGGMGGGRVFTEERHYEKNSTWDSREGGAPKVSEFSSWKTNEDGVIKSGSSRGGSAGQGVRGSGSSSEVHQGSSRHGSSVSHREFGAGSEYESGIKQESSSRDYSNREQSQGGHNSRVYTNGVRQESSSVNSQNWNSGRNEERISSSSSRHHSSTGSHGSGHRTFSGSVHEDDVNYEKSDVGYTRGQGTSDSRGHSHVEGTAHRAVTSDDKVTYSDNAGRRNDGKHQIHWSSEHSSGSASNAENHRGTANVESDVRRTIGSDARGQSNANRGKTIIEEQSREWNTTWSSSSGGKPRTTELTRWSTNEDGVLRNGSYRDAYEGTAKLDKDINKHLLVTNAGSGVLNIDQNLVKTGKTGTVYSEEKEIAYNTTWNSATGGKPITRQETNWKINKGGEITSGSKTDVFEGTPPPLHVSEGNIYGAESQGARRKEFNYENRHEERRQNVGTDGYSRELGDRSHFSGTESVNQRSSGERIHQQSGSSGRSSYGSEFRGHESDRHSESSGSRVHHHDTSGNSRYGENSGTFRTEHGRHHETSHQGRETNVGDLLRGSHGSSSQDASFGQFGEVARGPKDGVAKTYTLDLGINSGGSDGSRRGQSTHHSSSSGGSEHRGRHYSLGGSTSDQDEGSRGYSYRNQDRIESYGQGGSSSHSSWSHSTGSEQTFADGDNPQHGGSYGVRKVSDSAYHTRVTDDSNKGKFQLYPRYRRQVGEEDFAQSLDCGPTDCIRIKCMVGPLKKDEEAWVAFRSRVWVPTIKKISTNVEVGLSSLVAARVTRLPHIGSPDVVNVHTHEVHSQIMPPESAVKPDIIPLWIVVLAACAGAIILMLLVYLLYKCGFFKRNRPSNAPEKQPLNRNGYNHGDEAL